MLAWNDKKQSDFNNIKQKLTNTHVLRSADPNLHYKLTTDSPETEVR